MRKQLILFIIFIFSSFYSFGQNFQIPDYKRAEDFKTYEKDVLKAIDFLLEKPVDHPDRKEANAYVLAWAEGSPSVKVSLNGYVTPLFDRNPDLLMVYIGAWIKHELSDEELTTTTINIKATESLVKYYANDANHLKKDPDVKKLVKKLEKGNLADWVKSQL